MSPRCRELRVNFSKHPQVVAGAAIVNFFMVNKISTDSSSILFIKLLLAAAFFEWLGALTNTIRCSYVLFSVKARQDEKQVRHQWPTKQSQHGDASAAIFCCSVQVHPTKCSRDENAFFHHPVATHPEWP